MIFEKVQSIAGKKGLSIAEVEKRAQIGNGTIAKWKTSSPTIDNLTKVAKVLEVSIYSLLPEAKS
jgi:transcriptional regulator with XRE-family HTH domain